MRAAVVVAVAVAGLLQGCAAAARPGGSAGRGAGGIQAVAGPVAGRGSLRQEQISLRLMAEGVRVEVTPLAGWVLEAAAPDARQRLERIAEAYRPEGAAEGAVLFLVTFSSVEGDRAFHPDELLIVSRGLRERPAAIRAITPGWGTRLLAQQESAMAVYAFGESVDLARDLVVSYRGEEDGSWTEVLRRVEAERARGQRTRRNSEKEQRIQRRSEAGRRRLRYPAGCLSSNLRTLR